MLDDPLTLRSLIEQKVSLGVEMTKVDFKSELKLSPRLEVVETLKLISAIANSDADEDDGYGFIIYGASMGAWINDVPHFHPSKKDNLVVAQQGML